MLNVDATDQVDVAEGGDDAARAVFDFRRARVLEPRSGAGRARRARSRAIAARRRGLAASHSRRCAFRDR